MLQEAEARLAAESLEDDPPYASSMIAQRYLAGDEMLKKLALGTCHASFPSLEDKPSLILLPSPTARSVTLLFSGNNAEFALPAHYLLGHDTHLVLIRDRRRCFALAGLPGLGADYESCVESLRQIHAALGGGDLFVLGISAGASGAMKFACDLAAKNLLCFSAPTTLNLADDPGAELKHYPQLTQLYKADRSLGIDLAAYFAVHPTRPPAIFVYSEGHIRDAWLTLRMSGMEGVQLLPTKDYSGHTTYRWLILQKTINTYLDMLYPEPPLSKQAAPADSPETQSRSPATPMPGLRDQPLASRLGGFLRRLGRRRVGQGYAAD